MEASSRLVSHILHKCGQLRDPKGSDLLETLLKQVRELTLAPALAPIRWDQGSSGADRDGQDDPTGIQTCGYCRSRATAPPAASWGTRFAKWEASSSRQGDRIA